MLSGCILLVYQFEQRFLQHEMTQELNNTETPFTNLTMSLSEFKRDKIGTHELLIHGELYDFKSVAIADNKVTLLVFHDSEEEEVIKKMSDLTGDSSQQKSELPRQILKLLTLTYICPFISDQFNVWEIPSNNFIPPCKNITSIISEIPSPPPKLV
ncbi:hypothetical protein BH09BAC5_BH09BAC5_14270 [soil metagenome]